MTGEMRPGDGHSEGCDCDDFAICESCMDGLVVEAERQQGDGETCTGYTACCCPECRAEQEHIVEYVEATRSEMLGDPGATSWWAYIIDPGGAGVMRGVFMEPQHARDVAHDMGYEQVLIHGANELAAFHWRDYGYGEGAVRVFDLEEQSVRREHEIARGRRVS